MKQENCKLKFLSNLTAMKEVLQKAHKNVQKQFQLYEDKMSHSFDHIIRVTNTCLELSP